MIATWLVGVQGVTSGVSTVMFLRQSTMPDDVAALEEATRTPEGVVKYVEAVELRAVAEHHDRTLPLGIARAMLSLLLVVVSAMVLAGRPSARSTALQVLGANAVFGVVEYALTLELRAQWIGALARSELDPARYHAGPLLSPSFWYWASRLHLAAVEVGLPAAAALAVLSKRTQAFFEAARRAEQRREREDEP
jgi:hypothetical protein